MGDLDEGLAIIESLQDSSGECLLDVLDGSSLGNGGIGIAAGPGYSNLLKYPAQ